MPKIKVTKNFRFAERGLHVVHYTAGEEVEVSDECAEVATTENWAVIAKPKRATKSPETVAVETAPEVK